jgi:hypothetical protein
MKQVVLGIVWALTVVAFGQGTIILGNRTSCDSEGTCLVDAPVLAREGTNRVGSPFVAQLYVGRTPETVEPAGETSGFPEAAPGYFRPIVLALAGFDPGALVHCQVRVWDGTQGGTFEGAVRSGSPWGESKMLVARLGGGHAIPAVLSGLESFRLQRPRLGEVDFRNFVPGVVDAPVLHSDGATKVTGEGFRARLYAGWDTLSLRPIGAEASFGTADRAGYWEVSGATTMSVPGLLAGESAWFQVRVWESAFGPS